jgi:stage IV sporulation protein FB
MVEFSFSGTKYRLDFAFFAILGAGFLFFGGVAKWFLFAVILHEFTHIVFAKVFGAKIKEVRFYGAGIGIKPEMRVCTGVFPRVLILLSAPVVNLFLAFVYKNSNPVFSECNLFLGVFNLLPSVNLDGGAAIKEILGSFKSFKSGFLCNLVPFLELSVIVGVAFYVFLGNLSILPVSIILYLVVDLLVLKGID